MSILRFNLTHIDKPGLPRDRWISLSFVGRNHGPIMLMAENHRCGMRWEPMRGRRWIVDGLRCAGFDGGWSNAGGKPQS